MLWYRVKMTAVFLITVGVLGAGTGVLVGQEPGCGRSPRRASGPPSTLRTSREKDPGIMPRSSPWIAGWALERRLDGSRCRRDLALRPEASPPTRGTNRRPDDPQASTSI